MGLCDEELDCFDGIDEDADGQVDCDDTECAGVLGCGGAGTVVFEEDFEVWPLADWTLTQDGDAASGWGECADVVNGCDDFTNFATPYLGAAGSFAYINSDDVSGEHDASLTTPEFSLDGFSNALLTYDLFYNYFSGDVGTVEVSIDGGTTWSVEATYTSDVVGRELISLDSVAGELAVQVRFRYAANFDWWFAVDNVAVEAL